MRFARKIPGRIKAFAEWPHYLDCFHEILATTRDTGIPFPNGIKEHYAKETWFFDVRSSYSLRFEVPSGAQPVAGYGKDVSETSSDSERQP